MLSGLPVQAWELPEPLRPYLHDPTPPHLAISVIFLITIGALLYRSFRPRQTANDQARWVWLSVSVIILLANQQGDLQTPLLKMFRSAARSNGIDPTGTAALIVIGVVYTLVFAILFLALFGSASFRRPPGTWGYLGAALLMVHAAGRGATFLGLLQGDFAIYTLHNILAVIEVIGLVLLIVAALRFQPPRAKPQLEVPNTPLVARLG